MTDFSVLEVHDRLRKFAEKGHDIISNPGRISGSGRTNTHHGALMHHLFMEHSFQEHPALTTFLGNESGALTEVSSSTSPTLHYQHHAHTLTPLLFSSGGWEVEPSSYEYRGPHASAHSMEELAPHIHKMRSSGITPIFRDGEGNDTPTPIKQLQEQGFHMPTGLGEHAIETHGILTATRDALSTLEPRSFGGHLVIVGHTKGDIHSNYMYNLHDEKLHHIADFRILP